MAALKLDEDQLRGIICSYVDLCRKDHVDPEISDSHRHWLQPIKLPCICREHMSHYQSSLFFH